MFSGIIERLGHVRSAVLADGNMVLDVETGFTDLELGESIAVNGTCLTVATYDGVSLAQFYASPETLQRTNLGSLHSGDHVNLERAVSMATRLSGHLVQGHVDGLARLDAVIPDSGAYRIELTLPNTVARYCVNKGSIALDGISLTLNAVVDIAGGECQVFLTIIPHTWAHTNLQARKPGEMLNVEADVMAKYVERLCKPVL
jgi:riboflavin synthase